MQFISPTIDDLKGEIFLDKEESFHAIRVVRHKKGDRIKIFDGISRYFATIKDIRDGVVVLSDFEKIELKPKKYVLNLFLPFIEKKDFEVILKQATELGVDNFIPLITEYTQGNFVPAKFDSSRFNKIIISAVKQSERASIPKISQPIRFSDIINLDKKFIVGFKSKNRKHQSIYDILRDMKGVINIMIGPEGGFSPYETEEIIKRFFLFNVGENILTSKTAAIALVSCLIYIIENESIF